MSTRELLSRRALGIAGAAAGVAAVAAQAEPAAAKKCRKKVVKVPATHVNAVMVCIEPGSGAGRGQYGYMIELEGVGLVVTFDGNDVPLQQTQDVLVPEASGEAGWLVYQIAGPVKAPAGAGAAGTADTWFGSFLVKSGEINGIVKLTGELIAGDPPPQVMVELERPSVVVFPYVP